MQKRLLRQAHAQLARARIKLLQYQRKFRRHKGLFSDALKLKDADCERALQQKDKACLTAKYEAYQRGLARGKALNGKLQTENNILEARCKVLQAKIDKARLELRP